MSRRGEPNARQVRKVLAEVARLRERGARARLGRDYGEGADVPQPPLGWKPILDDDGNVIPDPPPREPTDVPAADVEAARAEAD